MVVVSDDNDHVHGESCPVCGHDHAETVVAHLDGRGAGETIAVRECGACGELWGEPREFYGVLRE